MNSGMMRTPLVIKTRTQALGTPVGGEVFERDELVGDLLIA